MVHVLVLQVPPCTAEAGAALIDDKISSYGDKPDIIVFPECWYMGNEKHMIEKICPVIAKHKIVAVLGTMMERSGPKVYITSVVVGPDGGIVGKYRKRNLTDVGRCEPGSEAGIFHLPHLNIKIAILICFDIEKQDLLMDTISHSPDIIINPVYIGGRAVTIGKDLIYSNWKSAMETMSRKFEALASEYHFTLVRVDNPFFFSSASSSTTTDGGGDNLTDNDDDGDSKGCGGMGTSIVVGPYQTTYAPVMTPTCFSVYINNRPRLPRQEDFSVFCHPPSRERTERVDNTGNRYSTKSLHHDPSSIGHYHHLAHTHTHDLIHEGSVLVDATLCNPNTVAAAFQPITHTITTTTTTVNEKIDASAGAGSHLKIWNIATRRCLHDIIHPLPVHHLCPLTPSSFAATTSNTIDIFDFMAGKLSSSFPLLNDARSIHITTLVKSSSPSSVIYGDGNGCIHFCDVRESGHPFPFVQSHSDAITSMHLISDFYLVSSSLDRSICVRDIRSGPSSPPAYPVMYRDHPITALASYALDRSAAPSIIADGDIVGEIHLCDLSSSSPPSSSSCYRTISASPSSPISSIILPSSSTIMYTSEADSVVHLYNLSTDDKGAPLVHVMHGHDKVTSSSSSSSNSRIMLYSNGGRVNGGSNYDSLKVAKCLVI
eukprot:TRINITY_DN4271_c0_g1_i1.p1 TRINITY_DN4271_c0_g1~~TRINITY_DN4271_c0_g1_i1.p1  ORF type:complete len:657 (-),score=148.59 TRINITY_DN4271_c0_g1_i1:65-2035(-)